MATKARAALRTPLSGQRHRLLLAAGEPVRVSPGPVAEADPLDELPGPSPAGPIGLPRELERKQQILPR